MALANSLFSSISKFSFRRKNDREFKHIAPGLVPSASIAPKPAVPRTPPPRSPHPSPERPRSALAAAILSSSLTGRTFAIPPARTCTLSDADHSLSFSSLPQEVTALYTRDRRSEYLDRGPCLHSPGCSEEEELDDEEEEREVLSEKEEHIYQSLEKQPGHPITEPVYALPVKAERVLQEDVDSDRDDTQRSDQHAMGDRHGKAMNQSTLFQESQKSQSCISNLSSDVTMETNSPSPKAAGGSSRMKAPVRRTSGVSEAKEAYREMVEMQKEMVLSLTQQNAGLAAERRLLEERISRQDLDLHRHQETIQNLQQKSSQGEASSTVPPTGGQEEIRNLRLTVHRLSVELSRYQARFRTLSKHQSSRINSLPMTGSAPPWLCDMKYLSPLLLAYEDRMTEKDTLLQTVEEEVKTLHIRLEEVVTENEALHEQLVKSSGVTQQEWGDLQEQASLVLKENQVLLQQLEAQQDRNRGRYSQHQAEVTNLSKQQMLMEEERRSLQEELDAARAEIRTLRSRMEDAVTWDEHCAITGKLHRRLEQQESQQKQEVEELRQRLFGLQEEKKSVEDQNSLLTRDIRKTKQELQLSQQACRKVCRRQAVLAGELKECLDKEAETRLLLSSLLILAQRISVERDQLAQLASVLEQEKQGGFCKVLEGTVRLGKLHEKIRVYRGRASVDRELAERRLREQEEAFASYQREILHLQQQLADKLHTLDTVLQSKQDVEEELGVVWEAATRENQGMRETLLDSSPSRGPQSVDALHRASPGWLSELCQPPRDQTHNHSADESEEGGLDFYS